jgi:hypothetical protein
MRWLLMLIACVHGVGKRSLAPRLTLPLDSSVLSLYALAAPADSSKFMGMELHFKTPEREVLTGGAI